jgi:SAM-dependent methyltransferase
MEFSELAGLAGAHAEARAIQVALKLGMFEALSARTLDADELAAAIACDSRATSLLANAMAALGLLDKRADRYGLSDASRRFLIAAAPEYLGALILFDEAIFPLWSSLENSIRSGLPARTPDMYQGRPEETRRFIRAMDSLVLARGDARYLAANLDLSGVRSIADIGGGPGTYLIEFLRRYPDLKGTILDLPATLAVTREILAEHGGEPGGRIELVEFDYRREELPVGFDAAFLSNIIHSEDTPTNRALIHQCYRGLNRGGMVVIKDHVMNADLTQPATGAVFSLYLLLTTLGRDYSFEEIGGWLREAGLVDIRSQPLPSPPFSSSVVTARRT